MTCPPTCFCISPTAAPQRNLDGRQEEREGRYRLTSTTLTTCHLKSLVYILPFLDPELLVSMHKNVPRVRYPDVVLEDLLDDVGGDERVSSDRGGMVDASLRRDLELRRLKAHPEVVRVNQRLALHAVEDDTFGRQTLLLLLLLLESSPVSAARTKFISLPHGERY